MQENKVTPQTTGIDEFPHRQSQKIALGSGVANNPNNNPYGFFDTPKAAIPDSKSQVSSTIGATTEEGGNETQKQTALDENDVAVTTEPESQVVLSAEPKIPQDETLAGVEIANLRLSITTNINTLLADSGRRSMKLMREIKAGLINIMAGKTYEDFLAQENGSELALAVERLKGEVEADQLRQRENLLYASQLLEISPPNINQDIDIVPEEITELDRKNEDELEITVVKDGKKETISISTLAAIILFVTVDMMLFEGNICYAISNLESTGLRLAKLAGFDMSALPDRSEGEFNDYLVDELTPNKLIAFLEQRKGDEMYKFLSGLKKETRDKMIAGEKFGGLFGTLHQLNKDQISMILDKLDKNQIANLDIRSSS